MEVSPNVLRKETVQLLKKVNEKIEVVMLDDGLTVLKQTELLVSLYQAKSQCLNTLVLLRGA